MATNKLNSTTVIPLGLAVVCIGGAAAWMTKMSLAVDDHSVKIKESTESQESHYREVASWMRQVDGRLSGIEGELKRIPKKEK